jgi:hypothetical protein
MIIITMKTLVSIHHKKNQTNLTQGNLELLRTAI